MTATLGFWSIGKPSIQMQCDLDMMSLQHKVNLLWNLLNQFDPGLEGDPAAYEAYQRAAEVILAEANKRSKQ